MHKADLYDPQFAQTRISHGRSPPAQVKETVVVKQNDQDDAPQRGNFIWLTTICIIHLNSCFHWIYK